jgi:hypothetical protein
MENKKAILKADLPSGLLDLMRMFWEPEEASDKELNLPEAERVEAFLQWCRQDFNWEGKDEEAINWLLERGYSPMPSGSQTM